MSAGRVCIAAYSFRLWEMTVFARTVRIARGCRLVTRSGAGVLTTRSWSVPPFALALSISRLVTRAGTGWRYRGPMCLSPPFRGLSVGPQTLNSLAMVAA